MFKRILKFSVRLALAAALFAILGLMLPKLTVWLFSSPRIFSKDEVPAGRVAIVFGAGLRRDGTPTAILRDRVQTAATLYQQGKVDKLLMSGDNRVVEYNEPEAMRRYALDLGIPDSDIVLDYAGRRTYDTCYRASAIFQVDSAILVTQDFHLPRAVFLCNWFGVESVGAAADNFYYRKISRLIWNTRELFATTQAALDVYALKPVPVLGDPQPIN